MAERWSDDRLDDLSRRISGAEGVMSDVAVMKSEMNRLVRELDRNTKATEHVADQLEQSKLEPFTRARALRNAVLIAVVAACVSGAFVLLATLVAKS